MFNFQCETKGMVRLRIGPEDLACLRLDGQPIDPSAMSKAFASLVKKAGLDGVRFHDLRHTHATHLMRQGVPPKVVSERLGHSTVGITLDIYSHVMPDMQEDEARKVDAALRAALSMDTAKRTDPGVAESGNTDLCKLLS